jgi:septum formation protein
MGLPFQVVPSHVPEELLEGETPDTHVRRLSREKAREVQAGHPDALVIAGDTVVVLEGEILGKPRDDEEAEAMLLRLSGQTHTVVSGLALGLPGGGILDGVHRTQVTFRGFGAETARAYVKTGETQDKAGAYGIQGMGGALVQEVSGDYNNVVGLPVPLLLELLALGGWRYDFGELVPDGAEGVS